MRSYLIRFVCTPVLLIYMMTTMGFGMHVCSYDNSIDILLLSSSVDCSDIHSHHMCSCDGGSSDDLTHNQVHNHDHSHMHNSDCCKTDIFNLNTDSESVTKLSIFKNISVISNLYTQESHNIGYNFSGIKLNLNNLVGFSPFRTLSNSSLSVWRL